MNFNNAEIKDEGGEFQYLDEGIHEVIIFDFKFGESKHKKTEFVNFMFKNDDGLSHFEDFYTTEKSLWRIKRLSLACGFLNDSEYVAQDLIGKRVKIEIIKESFTGQDGDTKYSKKIKNFYPSEQQNGQEYKTSQDPF